MGPINGRLQQVPQQSTETILIRHLPRVRKDMMQPQRAQKGKALRRCTRPIGRAPDGSSSPDAAVAAAPRSSAATHQNPQQRREKGSSSESFINMTTNLLTRLVLRQQQVMHNAQETGNGHSTVAGGAARRSQQHSKVRRCAERQRQAEATSDKGLACKEG
jgi:hypothetical protein